jgi:hypothetical protein
MKCGVSTCRYRAKRFGVCGVHKKWSYTDENLAADTEDFRRLITELKIESAKLESAGINILGIQSCWNMNLCGPRTQEFPEHFKKIGMLFEQMISMILDLQKRHDTYLVSNYCDRIRHSILDPGCDCQICNLGKV